MMPEKCKECPVTFATPKELNLHVATAHYSPVQKCQKCDFSSTTRSRVEAHFESVHKRPWIIPNNEEVEEEEAGRSNTDPNEAISKRDDNPDDPEPMDDTPVDESTKGETEAPRYDSYSVIFHLYYLISNIDAIVRLPPGKPLTAAELDDLRQRLKGKRQALATNRKILEQTGSTQPDGGAKLRECIEKIEVREHKNPWEVSNINLSIINSWLYRKVISITRDNDSLATWRYVLKLWSGEPSRSSNSVMIGRK